MIDFFSQGHANLPKSWRSQCRGKLENQTKDNVQFNQFPFVYFRTHDQMRSSFVVSQKKMNKEHTRGDRSHSYRLKLSHDISLIFFCGSIQREQRKSLKQVIRNRVSQWSA